MTDTPNARSSACQSQMHGVCQGYTEPHSTYACACWCHAEKEPAHD